MSLWSRIKGRFTSKPPPSEPTPTAEEHASDARAEAEPLGSPRSAPAPARPEDELSFLTALARGDEVDPELALGELRRARGTSRERAALERVLGAHRAGRSNDALGTAASELYLARGQSDPALELISAVRTPEALLLAADIHAERKELARAITLVERVLLRDIDAPGARERHERWRRALGGPVPAALASAEPTLLRSEALETSLRIVGEAGRGGAGTVYEAIDDSLGRRVALKVYHRPEQEREKLEREARSAVRFAGRGVVRVFDVDVERGFIVMEWLAGKALRHWVKRGDVSYLWPIESWLLPLVEVLSRVHAADVVHGDIKPANLLFRCPGEPVLTDFGLARAVGQELPGGSLGYLSPERLERGVASTSDDVYALGRLLEDVLEALARVEPELGPSGEARRWHALLPGLLSEPEQRPPDARRLLERLGG